VEDVQRLAGRPRAFGDAIAVFARERAPIPTSRDRTRRSMPRFAHESDEISKAVYQALPLCIVAALQGYAEAYALQAHREASTNKSLAQTDKS
jgi:hypothetical protein